MSRDALVVGINTYQHLPVLQAPAHDAESVARCLESFGECRVVRLPEAITHQKPEISQRGGVTTALLEEALIKLFKPAGKTIPQTAIFYYSGHGLQRQAGIQEGYLATSDANPAVGHYGLSLHWLRRLLQESPVRQRVILLDCCNSGEFFNMLEADPGARSGTDRLFMAAAREYEAAYESLNSNHSVFTQALLSGLNPYKIKGGIVNGHSLTDTVNRELKSELQQPLFESSGSEIVLTRISGMTSPAGDTPPPLLERLQKLRYGFCPFPGIAPFEAAHSEFFFGRDEITQTLVDRVQSSRLCVVTGASGIGKTSLLRAGLLPNLAKGEGSTAWTLRYVALGSSPLASLAEAFVDPGAVGLPRAEQLSRAESFLQRGADGFCQLIQALVGEQGAAARLVLVVDQIEALLTPAMPDHDRRLVVDCLTTAVQNAHIPVHLVLGLQAHQVESLNEFPDFKALVADHSLAVPAMNYNQLKATIIGPLEKVGLRYDANLVYTLLLDIVSAPADLALLQLILKELWLRRESTPKLTNPPHLTLAAYAKMGGVRHLLNQRADELYEGLTTSEQAIAQRIFLSLCDLGDGAMVTRRPVSLPELVTETMPEPAVVAVLDKLMAARLVVAHTQLQFPSCSITAHSVPGWASAESDGSLAAIRSDLLSAKPATSLPYFDIAHEALIRNWPLLQECLQTQGPRVKQQRTIEGAAQEWQQQEQPNHPDYFLTKTRLNEAKAFQQAHPDQLSVLANRYLQACDRYTKRCGRQRHLVRLLIPLSMATGMLTAYGHSYLSQPETGFSLAPEPRVNMITPAFNLADPPTSADGDNPTHLGSPQTGVIRTNMLPLSSPLPSPPPLAHRTAAPQLRAALTKMTQDLEPLIHSSNGWKATQTPVPPVAAHPSSNLPPANQVVKLEAWSVSPDDPSVIIQIWCTSTQAEPVCFTSTAARSQPGQP
ncbi:MAG: hypothetical protein DCF32_04630 [Leptolyngbya sp.]|nr:MAG: hypothetical protein DCF32_04630 [Leptolyngbya sp.]